MVNQTWLRTSTAFTAVPAFSGSAGRLRLAPHTSPAVFYHSARATQYPRNFIDNLFTFFFEDFHSKPEVRTLRPSVIAFRFFAAD